MSASEGLAWPPFRCIGIGEKLAVGTVLTLDVSFVVNIAGGVSIVKSPCLGIVLAHTFVRSRGSEEKWCGGGGHDPGQAHAQHAPPQRVRILVTHDFPPFRSFEWHIERSRHCRDFQISGIRDSGTDTPHGGRAGSGVLRDAAGCTTFMRGLVIFGLAVTDWEDGA